MMHFSSDPREVIYLCWLGLEVSKVGVLFNKSFLESDMLVLKMGLLSKLLKK